MAMMAAGIMQQMASIEKLKNFPSTKTTRIPEDRTRLAPVLSSPRRSEGDISEMKTVTASATMPVPTPVSRRPTNSAALGVATARHAQPLIYQADEAIRVPRRPVTLN
ncbi:hypothetical protein MRX96_052489 [Rhipicephalus microplus]